MFGGNWSRHVLRPPARRAVQGMPEPLPPVWLAFACRTSNRSHTNASRGWLLIGVLDFKRAVAHQDVNFGGSCGIPPDSRRIASPLRGRPCMERAAGHLPNHGIGEAIPGHS